jgi:hypothetical protein
MMQNIPQRCNKRTSRAINTKGCETKHNIKRSILRKSSHQVYVYTADALMNKILFSHETCVKHKESADGTNIPTSLHELL